MRSDSRRSQLDHERYMAHREERLQKQKEYYRENKEKYTTKHRAEVWEKKKGLQKMTAS